AMPMLLEGSCHCGAVRFSVESNTPYPFMRCYCSICRKTAGSGGYAINIMGRNETLKVEGSDAVVAYQSSEDHYRHFCRHCGSQLWIWSPSWPELVHPHASAIDTDLPIPPELVAIMEDSAPSWVELDQGAKVTHFSDYPDESIEDWHKAR